MDVFVHFHIFFLIANKGLFIRKRRNIKAFSLVKEEI